MSPFLWLSGEDVMYPRRTLEDGKRCTHRHTPEGCLVQARGALSLLMAVWEVWDTSFWCCHSHVFGDYPGEVLGFVDTQNS